MSKRKLQNIYEKMRAYAATMTGQAIGDNGTCMYRSPNGPCLIGLFLSDRMAKKADDNCGAVDAVIIDYNPPKLRGVDENFLNEAQNAHDEFSRDEFPAEALVAKLDLLAIKYGLKVSK